jgi:uncharacterized protein (UPF0248 family)
MITIQELINRIRWDEAFGQGDFRLGYYDRVADRIVYVPLQEIILNPDDHFAFTVLNEDGEVHSVPFHRVREVYRNGELIWRRNVP